MNRDLFVAKTALALLSIVALAPAGAHAAGVKAGFDLSAPDRGPFPSDRFTVEDEDQLTRRRVDMPLPECATFPSECVELEVVNTLDGFNPQPRLSVPFSGAIDPNTVTSASMFLVPLGDADRKGQGSDRPEVIGINQVVWDPATNTLHVQSDQFLRQHTRYLLVVTNGIRDAGGDPVEAGDFARFRHDDNFGQTGDRSIKTYRKELLDGLQALENVRVRREDVVAASVFTTRSVTPILEKIRDQIKASLPAPARFDTLVGSNRPAVFALADIAVNGMTISAQTSAAPGAALAAPVPIILLEAVRNDVRGAVQTVAFGKYISPDYRTAERLIPAVPTRNGLPTAQGSNEIFFDLFLPAGTKPRNGWPVAIFGHGLGASKEEGLFSVTGRLAAHGIASIGINAPGHGQGAGGRLFVKTSEGVFTVPSGGRGIDVNHDPVAAIDDGEGVGTASPRNLIIHAADGIRQTVIDTMQLVRVIEAGMDVDGDGGPDLDPSRIYYVGQSLGGMAGTIFLAVEPGVLAGDLNVPGGPSMDVERLGGAALRAAVGTLITTRQPSLQNAPAAAPLFGFNENIPFRNELPRINTVPGAMALQHLFDRLRWVQAAGDPVAYAPHLRQRPLEGMPPKDVIIQFAKGDKTMVNPTTTALIRAGNLADRATYYRYDLVFPKLLATGELTSLTTAEMNRVKNPHNFMPNRTNPPPAKAPKAAAIAFTQRDRAQEQVAVFFESNGETTIDPDGDGPFFETPIAGPLPEDLNFIP